MGMRLCQRRVVIHIRCRKGPARRCKHSACIDTIENIAVLRSDPRDAISETRAIARPVVQHVAQPYVLQDRPVPLKMLEHSTHIIIGSLGVSYFARQHRAQADKPARRKWKWATAISGQSSALASVKRGGDIWPIHANTVGHTCHGERR